MPNKTVLPNGVRVLSEADDHVRSIAVGLWCRTGSRHEYPGEEGITHFIEHMLFKGTAKRTALQIAEAIEGRGGVLNAFTDKEHTCYYCRVLADDLEHAVDVLTDMMTGSLLDPEELNREKGVVIEEIKRSEDEPGDYVHDLHMEARWKDHPLGKPVIGTKESVSSFQPENLRTYMARRYRAENVVLSAAGYLDHSEFVRLAEERLGGLAGDAANPQTDAPSGSPGLVEHKKDVEQVHFCIGADSVRSGDPQTYKAVVLDAVLGSGMSSRLFQEIREKRGLAYSVGSYQLAYTLGGAFTVYGGTNVESWPLVQELVRVEFDKLMRGELGADELNRAKRNVSGNIVLALESMSARMTRMTKNEFIYGRDVPVAETLARIDAVTVGDVVDFAQQILGAERVGTTAIVPR